MLLHMLQTGRGISKGRGSKGSFILGSFGCSVRYGVLEASGGQLPQYTHILAAGYTNNFN